MTWLRSEPDGRFRIVMSAYTSNLLRRRARRFFGDEVFEAMTFFDVIRWADGFTDYELEGWGGIGGASLKQIRMAARHSHVFTLCRCGAEIP